MDDFAEFRHFRFLLALAEHKSFRAAAQALNTGQPNLSRQVKEFEKRYKIKLFRQLKDRTIELTPAGEAMRIIARDVLEMRSDALTALEAIHRGASQILRIGCAPFIDRVICSRALELEKRFLPGSEIRFTAGDTKELLEELFRDELDACLLSLPIEDKRLRVEIVKRERMVVCLPAEHPLAKKQALSARDLTENLTVFRHPSHHPEAHERLRELLMEVGIQFEEHSHVSHPHEMQESVKAGYGFALMREGVELLDGLTARPIIGVDWTVDSVMVFKKDTSVPILPLIARSLRKEFLSPVAGESRRKPPRGAPADVPSQMSLIA